MKSLLIKSDNPKAEIYIYDGKEEVVSKTWEAHRALARDLLKEINELLSSQNMTPEELNGIAVFEGPGSFTGLRIGITTANTLAYSLEIPIVSAMGESWIQDAITKLENGENQEIVAPHYGAEANITKPKK